VSEYTQECPAQSDSQEVRSSPIRATAVKAAAVESWRCSSPAGFVQKCSDEVSEQRNWPMITTQDSTSYDYSSARILANRLLTLPVLGKHQPKATTGKRQREFTALLGGIRRSVYEYASRVFRRQGYSHSASQVPDFDIATPDVTLLLAYYGTSLKGKIL
jgi:hypothetical protein